MMYKISETGVISNSNCVIAIQFLSKQDHTFALLNHRIFDNYNTISYNDNIESRT